MIYKNQKLLWACSKEPKIRKKAPTKKHKFPAMASITKQHFTSNSNSENITIDSSEERQEFTEGHTMFGHSPSSQTPILVLLVVLLFITIYAKHYYCGTPRSHMERPSHRYADSNIQISVNQHQLYHFFHRTRHKPQGQPTSPPPLQPTDQPTGLSSSFPSSQPIGQPSALSMPTAKPAPPAKSVNHQTTGKP